MHDVVSFSLENRQNEASIEISFDEHSMTSRENTSRKHPLISLLLRRNEPYSTTKIRNKWKSSNVTSHFSGRQSVKKRIRNRILFSLYQILLYHGFDDGIMSPSIDFSSRWKSVFSLERLQCENSCRIHYSHRSIFSQISGTLEK